MQTEIFCAQCHECYSDEKLPRLLIACGHTFCQQCLLSFIVQQQGFHYASCPEDNCRTQTLGFCVKKFPKNLALIKAMQTKKNQGFFKDIATNISKITKNSSNNEQLDCELMNILNECNNQKIVCTLPKLTLEQINKKNEECHLHKKPLDIVCIVDLKKICASCAIFGKHKGHDFKSLQEVNQIYKQYCNSLGKIMNQKQMLTKQINCNETKNDILGLLASKKDKLRKKIIEQFSNLQNKIMAVKKETLSKLDQISKKQQQNIKNCIKYGDQLTKNYSAWHEKSLSQLKILQQNDLEAKLILLFEGKNIDGDIIQEGHQLIKQMKKEQQKILIQVQKKLQGLSINVNHEVYSQIDNFISVKCEQIPSIEIIMPKLQLNLQKDHQPYLDTSKINSINMQRKQSIQSLSIPKQNSKQINPITTTYEEFIKKSTSQAAYSSFNSPNLDESLLQDQKQNQLSEPRVTMFQLRMSNAVALSETMKAPLSQRFSLQMQVNNTPPQRLGTSKLLKTKEVPQMRPAKMDKKKLSKLKLSDKYEKIVEALITDSLQIIDLTNAQLGDSNLAAICENIGPKARTLKLIRNKLTDEGIAKILVHLGNIVTLNVSQNLLTDNILDILYESKKHLPSLKNLILSQNKIVERKHKAKIEKIKKFQWNLSL